jgi:hypothetical protein
MDFITVFAWVSLILLVFMIVLCAFVFSSPLLGVLGIALFIAGVFLLGSVDRRK